MRERGTFGGTIHRHRFAVEICDSELCVTDVYGFEDLPLPVREIVETENRLGHFEWHGPDGTTWRVKAAYV
jgi:hypothetical protein